ncbi:hypothetical protein ACTFIR_011894 [Dictyostelium discoideum]
MEIESIEYSTNNTINPSTGYSLVVLNKCLSKVESNNISIINTILSSTKNITDDSFIKLDNNNLKDKFEILWFKNQQQQFPASKSFILNNKLIRALISKKVHYVETENEKEIEGFGKIGFEKHEVDDEHKDKNEEEDEGVEDDDEEVKEGDSEENEEEEDDYDDYDEVNQEDDDYDDEDDKDNHQKLLAKLAPQIKLYRNNKKTKNPTKKNKTQSSKAKNGKSTISAYVRAISELPEAIKKLKVFMKITPKKQIQTILKKNSTSIEDSDARALVSCMRLNLAQIEDDPFVQSVNIFINKLSKMDRSLLSRMATDDDADPFSQNKNYIGYFFSLE